MLIETGLRGGDACNLAFSSVFQDSTGWPCLRFEATKVRTEQLVPLSAKAAAVIAAQQAYVREHFPVRQPVAVPRAGRQCRGHKALFALLLLPPARRLARSDRPARPGRPTGPGDRRTSSATPSGPGS